MKRNKSAAFYEKIVFPRSDPIALACFDPATKECVMNCGKHIKDPRSDNERKFQCEDCYPALPTAVGAP